MPKALKSCPKNRRIWSHCWAYTVCCLSPTTYSWAHGCTLNISLNVLMLKVEFMGRGGGQVVSVLAFYSDDPSSHPTEALSFSIILCLKRTKINKKRPGLAHFFKKLNLGWANPNSYVFTKQLQWNNILGNKNCQWQDLNRRSIESVHYSRCPSSFKHENFFLECYVIQLAIKSVVQKTLFRVLKQAQVNVSTTVYQRLDWS